MRLFRVGIRFVEIVLKSRIRRVLCVVDKLESGSNSILHRFIVHVDLKIVGAKHDFAKGFYLFCIQFGGDTGALKECFGNGIP